MTRTLAIALLFVGLLVPGDVAISKRSAKVETIRGRIVAYSDHEPLCLRKTRDWSMLIHVQDSSAKGPSRFIEVRFSLSCKKLPKSLYCKPPVENFRLWRDQDADSVLEEFGACYPPHGCDAPLWIRVPSAEHEEIPFGQLVRNYRSVDLPPPMFGRK